MEWRLDIIEKNINVQNTYYGSSPVHCGVRELVDDVDLLHAFSVIIDEKLVVLRKAHQELVSNVSRDSWTRKPAVCRDGSVKKGRSWARGYGDEVDGTRLTSD